jgi:hypothetical protein
VKPLPKPKYYFAPKSAFPPEIPDEMKVDEEEMYVSELTNLWKKDHTRLQPNRWHPPQKRPMKTAGWITGVVEDKEEKMKRLETSNCLQVRQVCSPNMMNRQLITQQTPVRVRTKSPQMGMKVGRKLSRIVSHEELKVKLSLNGVQMKRGGLRMFDERDEMLKQSATALISPRNGQVKEREMMVVKEKMKVLKRIRHNISSAVTKERIGMKRCVPPIGNHPKTFATDLNEQAFMRSSVKMKRAAYLSEGEG